MHQIKCTFSLRLNKNHCVFSCILHNFSAIAIAVRSKIGPIWMVQILQSYFLRYGYQIAPIYLWKWVWVEVWTHTVTADARTKCSVDCPDYLQDGTCVIIPPKITFDVFEWQLACHFSPKSTFPIYFYLTAPADNCIVHVGWVQT